MSNNKQSSIEFLLDKIQLSQTTFTDSDGNKYIFLYPIFNINDIEQCKEMHKEEHGKTWDKSLDNLKARGMMGFWTYTDFDEYYNETFGGNK